MSIDVSYLELENGKPLFEPGTPRDIRGIVRIRINRLHLGNFGDCSESLKKR